jgi:hypothetical protein
VEESEGEGSILSRIVRVSRVDTFLLYLVEWLLFQRRGVKKEMKLCKVLK